MTAPTIAEAEAEAARILAANPAGGPEWDHAVDVLLYAMYRQKQRTTRQAVTDHAASYQAHPRLSVSG